MKDLTDPTNVDSVNAKLTPGEFVLNKEASAMFAPQIEAMNQAGLQQRHAENQALMNGGQVGYNVGGLVNFLKEKEGYKDNAYPDSGGVWTIGYGRTTNPDGSPVQKGQTTKREAEDSWLQQRAEAERTAIDAYAEQYGYDWNDGQKDALASFRYNGGQGMIDQLTDNGQRDNATIQEKFGQYNKVTNPQTGKKEFVQGLQNRRDAELELWGGAAPSEVEAPPSQDAPPPAPAGEGGFETQAGMQQPPPIAQDLPPEVPQDDAPGGFPDVSDGISSALGQAFQPQPLMQAPALQGVNPEYIPSVTAQQPAQTKDEYGLSKYKTYGTWNGGGPVQHLNPGGWFDWLKNRGKNAVDPYAGYANMTQEQALKEAQTFNNPGAQTQGYQVPGLEMPSQLQQGVQPLPPIPDTPQQRVVQEGGALQGRINMAIPPEPEQPPQVDANPPIPGSDEALLQGSSQQVEDQEDWTSMVDPRDLNAAGFDQSGNMATSGSGAIDSGIIGPDSAPSPAYIQAQVETGNLSIPDLQNSGAPPELISQVEESIARGDSSGLVPPEQINAPAIDQAAATIKEADNTSREQAISSKGVEGKLKSDMDQAGTVMSDIEKGITDNGGEDPNAGALAGKTTDDVLQAFNKVPQAQQGAMAKSAQNTLKQAFGDLFNQKELVRMGVLFAGALATGATPGQALSYAGQSYIARIDSQASTKQKYEQGLLKSGKYTPASIKAYSESEDPSLLIPTDPAGAPVELGNQKEFYGPGGQRIQGREVKVGDHKIWVDKNNKPIDLNRTHQEPSRVAGTPEYRERIGKESKQLGKTFEEMQERFGKYSTDQGDQYSTELIPGKVGLNAAKWAVENDVPIDAMGQLLDNAYQSALAESKGGKKARSITSYLNDQYIQSQVGDPGLFKQKNGESADSVKVNQLMNLFKTQLGNLPQYQGLSSTAISSSVIQKARPMWTKLDEDIRNRYNNRAGPGESGFMVWLKDQVAAPQ